ncbi:DNA mismatch repair protein MSH4-like [Zingiber officinale]|uniref:DNA mismatch repair protein MSH4-like n=1 Tax=Zingiber officinale TaxID=94328 RepID=UPI001C4D814D|nr:DNA mismatch repair protein MSH4-like [Zingiber officinale]
MDKDGGERSSFVLGLIENRAKEVGVAAFDLRSASLHLSQYIETSCSYQNTNTLLHFYDPMVIIVPPTKLAADGMVGVLEFVDKHYTSNKKVTLPRCCFDDTKGAVLVKSLAAKEPSALGLGSYHKQYYLCLAAAAATIKWIEAEQGVIVVNHSLLVTFNGSFDHLNIDATSVQNLEIIDSLHSESWSTGNKKRSLFQLLKTTKTIGGYTTIPFFGNQLKIFSDKKHFKHYFLGIGQRREWEEIGGIDDLDGGLQLVLLEMVFNTADLEVFTRLIFFQQDESGLIDVIREDVSILTLLAEVLCLLDMIVNSFAHTISTKPVDRYTRPEFTDNGPVAIDAGRHPILESVHNNFVPNNLFLSEASNMVIVMGPNMSGKSTYLQQVCLIIILAQIGCYIPARFASLRTVDRIFTRIGTGDNVEYNSSTFMTEMKETAFLMQNVSSKSLIVMDELGRATSSSDGFAIAWSCCEHLLSLKAYTVFATHMEGISEMATIYPNVKILHFDVELKNNRLDFKFHLKDGPHHVPHYGLLLAGIAGLPSSVVETARGITAKISEEDVKRMHVNCEKYRSVQMAYQVAQKLICLKYSNQSEDYIRQTLQNLQESYKMDKLN